MSIYNDPELREADEDNYPPTIKFEKIGDRAKGKVDDVSKFTSRNGVALKYKLTGVAVRLGGVQAQYPIAEIIAGSKNLKGQMMMYQPEKGDTLDIELTELRPSAYGNPTKIYRIIHDSSGRGESDVFPSASTAPTAPTGAAEADLFES
jgi:hypothetical protein